MSAFNYKKIKQAWREHTKNTLSFGSNPQSDWFLSLFIFTLLNLGTLIWGLSFFSQINSGTLFPVVDSQVKDVVVLKQADLDTFVKRLNQKNAGYTTLQNNPTPAIDPSL